MKQNKCNYHKLTIIINIQLYIYFISLKNNIIVGKNNSNKTFFNHEKNLGGINEKVGKIF